MESNKVIGGEFECAVQRCNTVLDSYISCKPYTYSSGRAALYNILLTCRNLFSSSVIYLPDYLCSTIIDTVEKADFQYVFYPIRSLNAEYADLEGFRWGGVMLLIDYQGIVDTEPLIIKLKNNRPDLIIVKDLVQSPYHLSINSFADFQFTSFRKIFPVPDGAWVLTKHSMKQPSLSSRFSQYKLAASLLKSHRSLGYYNDKIYLDLYNEGEKLIDEDITCCDMSNFTKINISLIDWQLIAETRRKNASIILAGLTDLRVDTLAPVSDKSVPLFIPVWLENRDKVRKAMFRNNIFLPVHWSIERCEDKLNSGRNYAKHELSIIIDQRYNESDMLKILDILEKNYQ